MAEANIKRRFIAVLPFSPFAAFIERAAGRIREDALQHPNAHATFMDKSYGQISVNGDPMGKLHSHGDLVIEGAKRSTTQSMNDIADSERYRAPPLDKGLDILELLASVDGGLTQIEIAKALGRSHNAT